MSVFWWGLVVFSGFMPVGLAFAWTEQGMHTAPYNQLIDRCEDVFPKVMRNPLENGGIFFDRVGGQNLTCIFGTQAAEALLAADLREGLTNTDVVVVMSVGGPVDRWLSLGRAMLEAKPLMIVDRICASSCANYVTPVAREILATKGSLIVWHGGPDQLQLQADNQEVSSIIKGIEYLTNQTGISETIYEFTTRPASGDVLKEIHEYAGEVIKSINGYALSPQRLTECFGYKNVDKLWHPGGNLQVYLTGQALATDLVFLESPEEDC